MEWAPSADTIPHLCLDTRLRGRHILRKLGPCLRLGNSPAPHSLDEQLVEFLAEQELDGNDLKFASRVLFEEPYLLAVPKDHRFARRQSVKLADLDGEPFIVRTSCDFYQE